jgi:hypothetical protein
MGMSERAELAPEGLDFTWIPIGRGVGQQGLRAAQLLQRAADAYVHYSHEVFASDGEVTRPQRSLWPGLGRGPRR